MISHKSFLLSKHDNMDLTQDWVEANPVSGLYAVADGVSNSYHPEYVSKALCILFTQRDATMFDNWPDRFRHEIIPDLQNIWRISVNEFVASLTPFNKRFEKARAERWHTGASTFCGVAIEEKSLRAHFAVIGDSTLFFVGDDGYYDSFCTSPSDLDEKGYNHIDYSSSTQAVVSDGTIVGEWLNGSIIIRSGYIVLLTDAMAKWFQDLHFAGLHPERILWELEEQNDFVKLAEQWRANGAMNDDLAVLILRIDTKDKGEVEIDLDENVRRMLPSLRLELLLPEFIQQFAQLSPNKSEAASPQDCTSDKEIVLKHSIRSRIMRKITDFLNIK